LSISLRRFSSHFAKEISWFWLIVGYALIEKHDYQHEDVHPPQQTTMSFSLRYNIVKKRSTRAPTTFPCEHETAASVSFSEPFLPIFVHLLFNFLNL
jgi:hypothetical protein